MTPEDAFEQLKQRAEAQAEQKARARAFAQATLQALQQPGVPDWRSFREGGPQRPDGPMPGLAARPIRDFLALTEGVPPSSLPAVAPLVRQIEENRERQQRLLKAGGDLFMQPSALDAAREAARLALGKALEDAVSCGLLDEDRAVAMIVAGRLNDQPMSPENARVQVEAALAQAVVAGATSTGTAEQLLAALAERGSLPVLPIRFSDGVTSPPPEDRNDLVRFLEDRVAALEALLYEALRIEPCHLSEHDELHRYEPLVCPQQAGPAFQTLLDGIGLPPSILPRVPHRLPSGERAPCCARDGRIGTWLVWGQTLDPSARFSSDAT